MRADRKSADLNQSELVFLLFRISGWHLFLSGIHHLFQMIFIQLSAAGHGADLAHDFLHLLILVDAAVDIG